jgi:putative Holliday junction resolvase
VRVLGIDYGERRVGIAISDPMGMTARPLEVVPRGAAVPRIAELVREHDVATIVVGMPTSLSGGTSASAESARTLGKELGRATGADVRYVDERFTSRIAEDALLEAGMKRRDRRHTVDKVAAAIILQSYLDGNSGANSDVEDAGVE